MGNEISVPKGVTPGQDSRAVSQQLPQRTRRNIPLNTKVPKSNQINFSSGKICLREQFSPEEI